MKLLLDSAKPDEIKKARGSVWGVTTNPALMAQSGISPLGHSPIDRYLYALESIVPLVPDLKLSPARAHLSVEVTSLDPRQMIAEATYLVEKFREEFVDQKDCIELFVKIPILENTLDVIHHLTDQGYHVNATAAMTALQAKLASDAGARVVSFFYNRMIDGIKQSMFEDQRRGHYYPNADAFEPEARRGALEEIRTFREITVGSNTRVICGSIRLPSDVLECWRAGADYVTAPLKVIREMSRHPKTDEAVADFDTKIKEWLR
jgi:transaldolase